MHGKFLLLGISIVAASACTKPDKKSDDVAGDGTKVGNINIDTDALATLNLSASLSPSIPVSVTAKGEGVQAGKVAIATLTTAERKKSREACNIRQKIREAKMQQDSMAMNLCFIEAQKGVKSGGKYKMKFSMPGDAALSPWTGYCS